GGPGAGERREDDLDGGVRIGSPRGVDRQRAGAGTRSQPVADDDALEDQRCGGAAFVSRPASFRAQRAVGGAAWGVRVLPRRTAPRWGPPPAGNPPLRAPAPPGEPAGLARTARRPGR